MVLFLKNLIFTVVVPGTVAGYVPFLIAGDRPPVSGVAFAAALGLLALGAACYGWCLWDFASYGRGTPAPIDAPKKLVVRGLYRYSRNPMYVGVLTVVLGWAVLFGSAALLIYALFLCLVFNLFIRLYEERHLRRLFGAQYRDYCARVGRWFPRPPGRPPA